MLCCEVLNGDTVTRPYNQTENQTMTLHHLHSPTFAAEVAPAEDAPAVSHKAPTTVEL